MNWFDHSIMARRAVAKGKPGTTHQLTEAAQGQYHYTLGPNPKPVLHIQPGDSKENFARKATSPASCLIYLISIRRTDRST